MHLAQLRLATPVSSTTVPKISKSLTGPRPWLGGRFGALSTCEARHYRQNHTRAANAAHSHAPAARRGLMSLCPSRSYAIADNVKATPVMHVTMSSHVDFVAGSSVKRSFIVCIRPARLGSRALERRRLRRARRYEFPVELVWAPWLKTLFLGFGGPARTYRKAECRSTRHLDEDRLERIADADYDAPMPPRRTHELAMLPSHRIPLGARDDRIRPLASPVDIFFRPAGLLAHRPRPRFDAIRWRVSCGPSARCKMIGRLAIVIRHAVSSARLCRGVKKSALRA